LGVVKLVKFLTGVFSLSMLQLIFSLFRNLSKALAGEDLVIKPVPSVTMYLFLYE